MTCRRRGGNDGIFNSSTEGEPNADVKGPTPRFKGSEMLCETGAKCSV